MKIEGEEWDNLAGSAANRSNVYGLLAIIYIKEPTTDLLRRIKDPQLLGVFSNLGISFDEEFLDRPEEELLETLAVEYAALFLGPGKHISPHESVHRNDSEGGMLWSADTVKVKEFIESSGFAYQSDYSGLPDHIGVEFHFMHEVTGQEARAWREKKRDEGLRCLEIEKKFIKEHIMKWVPAFCDKVIKFSEHSFYREMALLTKNFVEFEVENMDSPLSRSATLEP